MRIQLRKVDENFDEDDPDVSAESEEKHKGEHFIFGITLTRNNHISVCATPLAEETIDNYNAIVHR